MSSKDDSSPKKKYFRGKPLEKADYQGRSDSIKQTLESRRLKEYYTTLKELKDRNGLAEMAEDMLKENPKDDIQYKIAVASMLLKKAQYGVDIINGLRLYDNVGKLGAGIRIALNSIEKNPDIIHGEQKNLEGYIEKHKKEQVGFGSKIPIFFSLLAGGFGLGMMSLALTGNAVNNSSATNSSIIGIILIFIGLIGAYFYFKRGK